MFVFYFTCLTFSKKFIAPKIAMIWSDKHFTSDEISEIKIYFKKVVDYAKNSCNELTGDDKDKCIAVLNGFLYVYPTKSKNINPEISKITNDVDFLYIVSGDIDGTVDLNKLKRQIIVLFLSKREIDSKILSQNDKYETIKQQILIIKDHFISNNLELSKKTIAQLSNALSPKTTYKGPKTYDYDLNIKGNIKSKVSFLTIVKYKVKIITNDLNCQSVYMNDCTIDDTGMKIKSDFFLANDDTHCELFGCQEVTSHLYEMVETKQYALVYFNSHYYEDDFYLITHNSYSWTVTIISNDYHIDDFHYITPYSFCDVFSVFSSYTKIVIDYDEKDMEGVTELKPLNLTIAHVGPTDQLPFKLQEAETIFVGSSNDVWEIPLKLTLTYDKSEFVVETTYLPDTISVTEESIYTFRPVTEIKKTGMIVGIVVAVVVVIAIVVVVVIIVIKKKKNNASQNSEQENDAQ